MSFLIERHVYEKMLAAARAALPLEACGLLGGKARRVSVFAELSNADASNEHYRMLPEEQFAVVKGMRAEGVGMLANWHSHPDTPARMSKEDLDLAYTPGLIYVIVSLADRAAPDVRGFKIEDGRPQDIEVEVVEDSAAGAAQDNSEDEESAI